MIVVKITKELVAQAFSTGNELHLRIADGLPPGSHLIDATATRDGILTLKFLTAEDVAQGTQTEKAITVTTLPCSRPRVVLHDCVGQKACPEPTCPEYAR